MSLQNSNVRMMKNPQRGKRERERERVENILHNRQLWTSINPSNTDCANGLHFLQESRAINAEHYSNILFGEVKDKIRSKRKTGGNWISFLQDNVRPHTARKTMETFRKLKWDLLPHPSYSPSVACGALLYRISSKQWIKTLQYKQMRKSNKYVFL